MCSICGGTQWDPSSQFIWGQSQDRGRDAHGMTIGVFAWIGNHRAIPTTEVENPLEKQPVENDLVELVFNGIIANDQELGVKEGEADTSVLPRVLDFTNLYTFRDSLEQRIVGSYAIAVRIKKTNAIWLACNYKPIWIGQKGGRYYFSSLAAHFPAEIIPYRMPPYSVQRLGGVLNLPIARKQSLKALVICSSGLDSTAVAAYARKIHGGENTTLIHYNYGCRATSREIEQVTKISEYLGTSLKILPMPSFGGSSLLDPEAEISEGAKGAEYAHEWVPARNLLMLSMAVAYAEAKGFGHIYLGTNLEEAGAYPDNEEQFILDFNNLLYGAVQNGIKIEIHTPLGGLMKHEIIPFGNRFDTPFHLTWSCYHGGDKACGKCGPCFMRQTAFKRNGLIDPIEYESE